MQKSFNRKKLYKNIFVAVLLLPAILHFFIFYLYINGSSILLAVHDEAGFTGKYLVRFFSDIQDGNLVRWEIGFWSTLKNTMLLFILGEFFLFPLSLLFSYTLYKKVICYKFFRVVFFLPSIISAAVLVGAYKEILGPGGPIDLLQQSLTGNIEINFINSPRYAMWSVVIYKIWIGIAGNMIYYSGTMARIPQEVVESAKLDGIGFFGEMFHIVIPLIWPTLSTLLLISFMSIFGATGPLLVFGNAEYYSGRTMTIAYQIFKWSVADSPDYNYASAVGLFFTLIQLPIVFLIRFILSKLNDKVEY